MSVDSERTERCLSRIDGIQHWGGLRSWVWPAEGHVPKLAAESALFELSAVEPVGAAELGGVENALLENSPAPADIRPRFASW